MKVRLYSLWISTILVGLGLVGFPCFSKFAGLNLALDTALPHPLSIFSIFFLFSNENKQAQALAKA
jgi:hypothetical protein